MFVKGLFMFWEKVVEVFFGNWSFLDYECIIFVGVKVVLFVVLRGVFDFGLFVFILMLVWFSYFDLCVVVGLNVLLI